MKKLIVIIAIVMIFVLFMGNLNKIDNLIADVSSKIEDTTTPGTSSGDVTTSNKTYTFNIQLKELGTGKYITTFTMTSTKNEATFYVDSNNDIILMAADGAMVGLDTDGWYNISLSATNVSSYTTTVYVSYSTSSDTGTGNNSTNVTCSSCGNYINSYNYESGGDGTGFHELRCQSCKNPISNESCSYVNGTCTKCGQVEE